MGGVEEINTLTHLDPCAIIQLSKKLVLKGRQGRCESIQGGFDPFPILFGEVSVKSE